MIKVDNGRVMMKGDAESLTVEMVTCVASYMSTVCDDMTDECAQELCTFVFNSAWELYKGEIGNTKDAK